MAAPWRAISLEKSHSFIRSNSQKFLPYNNGRCYCQKTDEGFSKSPFWRNIAGRKDQASRSILARLSGKTSEESLLQYCNSHGKVVHSFTYHQQLHGRYALVEFKTTDAVNLIIDRAYASNHNTQVQSRFLSFSGSGQSSNTAGKNQQLNKDCSIAELQEKLAEGKSVSDQLDILTKEQELSDSETRLRFLVCSLIEEAFHKILPDCSLHLFGSSVNGFGRRSCDVDMFLDRKTAQGIIPVRMRAGEYKLKYDQQSADSERVATQATLSTLASYLEKQVPHCMSVARILQAKCPLVKFRHHATGLSCDLTGDNRIALKSSELLYIYGHLDPRVRPLVFMIRHWARYQSITSSNPGYWITNFPLTLLVVYFLQSRPKPIVPSFDYLQSLAVDSDRCMIDGMDCTIPSDLTTVVPSENTQTSAELLHEFFKFCTSFDFEGNSVSVRSGTSSPKQDPSFPLHMQNPFEPELNMCKNVSQSLLQDIHKHSHHALQIMDLPGFQGPESRSEVIQPWGIGALLTSVKARRSGKRSLFINNGVGNILRGLSREKKPSTSSTENVSTVTLTGNESNLQPSTDSTENSSTVTITGNESNLQPSTDSTENSSTVTITGNGSNLQGLSHLPVQHTNGRTVQTQTLTALDASLKSHSTVTSESEQRTPNNTPSNKHTNNNIHEDSESETALYSRPGLIAVQPVDSHHQNASAMNGVDGTLTESQASRKHPVPKLQITINDVRRRLFYRRQEKVTKGIVH
ncbi:poly(A) RNA polymerase, mitochondrial-like [Asterias amurensis]|uniref:poly(A) RNA polymerase, mitochondrial-like n=1 Tax=Asterias amurensis TaxID=7602 RepID=UPI003AB46C77